VGGLIKALSMRAPADRVFVAIVAGLAAAGLFGGALVMSPGTLDNGAPDYTFFLIMLVITAAAAAANAYHPVEWTREEMRFAVGAPTVIGLLALVGGFFRQNYTLLEVGVVGIGLGAAVAAVIWVAGKLGFGPLAVAPPPSALASYAGPPAPAPNGWLRLGSGFGLPAAWMAACILVLPFIVYIALYIPWSQPWQTQTATSGQLPAIACWHFDQKTQACDNAWPAGHTGQTLWDLTIQMYNYHNDLRASHAASSPWWAWPMDLKPVWFENANFGGDTATMIYDGGNPALWWLAIFAMGFISWQAFKRRSLGLTLIAIAFFWQWLSWARIDRAAFQYHFYTALPFYLAALAYFLAELWHGPSRRTWLLARFAAAAALIFPAATWVLKYPLCGLARVSTSDYWGNTICGSGTGNVVIEGRLLLIAVVLVLALVALGLVLWRIERSQSAGNAEPLWIPQLLVPVGIAGVLVWWIGQNGSHETVFQAALPSDGIALVLLPVLAILAFVVLTAKNPRRFVLGACAFGVIVFVALYPNLSALPLPNTIINVYEALLPTWFYGFQFSDNLQTAQTFPILGTASLSLSLVALLVAGIAAWAAWERRVAMGYWRAHPPAVAPALATQAAPGPATDPAPALATDAVPAAADPESEADELSGPHPTKDDQTS
jgi:hypothetical protein